MWEKFADRLHKDAQTARARQRESESDHVRQYMAYEAASEAFAQVRVGELRLMIKTLGREEIHCSLCLTCVGEVRRSKTLGREVMHCAARFLDWERICPE